YTDVAEMVQLAGVVVGPYRGVAPEVQPVRGHVEPAMQGKRADDDPIRVMVAAERCHLPHDGGPSDAVHVAGPQDTAVVYPDEAGDGRVTALEQAAAPEQDGPEAIRRPRGIRGQGVVHRLRDAAAVVAGRLPPPPHPHFLLTTPCA